MSLTTYNKKRDFSRTPEPRSGKAAWRQHKLIFVVQRHSARKLHYDFRIELEGVLRSWAIPKGPSMVAGEKRLAVMVEDHPLKYGRFFGEIPAGNYGAGKVEIWDKGTYRPSIDTDNPVKALTDMINKGDIKLTLNGEYLKGRFALFRLKGDEKENEWMLVKKTDGFAEETFDIESFPPLKSMGNRKEVKNPKIERTDPFPDPLPKPMLAKQADRLIDNPGWISEVKLDGYRMLCAVRERKVKLVSRNGKSFNGQFAVLLDDLGKIEEDLVLDGEIVAVDSKGRSDFQHLQEYVSSQRGNLRYYVFDILFMSGHNLMTIPLKKRKELLEAFFRKYKFRRVFMVESLAGSSRDLFETYSKQGYEGIIIKDPESSYLPGKRSDSWLKIKAVQKQEALICGYTLPRGSRKGFGSLILGLYDGGRLKYIGNCGTGFSDFSLKDLPGRFRHLETDQCPFDKPVLSGDKSKPVWLVPQLIAAIKFTEWTDEGLMRLPVFIGLREDKQPEEVVNELAESTGPEGRITEEISGYKVKLTHLSRVYWKEEGYTKGDLISYYQNIGKYLLPYLKDRPQSLNRYPGGIEGESFYHKNMDPDLVPNWVKTVRMDSGSHTEGVNYLVCNNIATLIYMINLGCIEINPWHSTYRKPDFPTYIIIDLDPGNISFKEVVNTALVIKEICDESGIPCYPKTSGATGIHVYIPLGAKYDYDQARTFAEILASLTHNRLLATTSIERSVAKREDKVYIDFLQNRKGQTIAAPYSVRPRPLATVSAPLLWKEVNHKLSPEMFTIKNMGKRLTEFGDLWQPVLQQGISLLKALKAIGRIS